MSAERTSKTRVAILGGGCGAMAAACYLTSTKELCEKYEVTVYQQGWRLGGKGGTGRDQRANFGDRIYEHGLHMWLGWYDNAFKLIQDVYAEWKKPAGCPFQSWRDAFQPQRFFTLQQDITSHGQTRWVTRNIPMPSLPGTPGQFGSRSFADYFHGLVKWLNQLYRESEFYLEAEFPPIEDKIAATPWVGSFMVDLLKNADKILEDDNRPTHPYLKLVRLAAARLKLGEGKITPTEAGAMQGMAREYLVKFQGWLQSESIKNLSAIGDNAKWHWQMLDFITAVGAGYAADVLGAGNAGIQAINDEDFCDWIDRHGASSSTRWSAFSRAIYNLAFSFERGIATSEHARFEAGTALMVYLRMALGYKDAPMWRMRAGMGDTIFSPIYQVLKERGVIFKFFHRVTNLNLSRDKNSIASVEMDVQARIIDGDEYQPLYSPGFGGGKAFPCWPDEPRWAQIEDAAALQAALRGVRLTFESAWCDVKADITTLRQGEHFDQIVLGISVAGVKTITNQLSQANAAWHRMVDAIGTVQTQAVQLWMLPKLAELGWPSGSTIMTTYQEPLDTWGEMTDVLQMENWQGNPKPQSLHYFCGPMEGPEEPPLDDPDYPADADATVKQTALHWLQNYIGHLWPNAVLHGTQGLDFAELHDPANGAGIARFNSQFWRANIDPSERYVTSFPNTSIHRLRSDETGFSNLFLAGDWTVSSVNGGCVEAAVESGMAAARAICGVPANIPNYPER